MYFNNTFAPKKNFGFRKILSLLHKTISEVYVVSKYNNKIMLP